MQSAISKSESTQAALILQKEKLLQRLQRTQEEAAAAETQLRTLRTEWGRVKSDPDRLNKQAESVKTAIEQVGAETKKLQSKLNALEEEIAEMLKKKEEADAVARAAAEQLEAHGRDIDERQRDAAEVERNIRALREEQQHLVERKRELQAQLTGTESELRSARTSNQAAKSQYERGVKELKRRIALVDSAKALLPMAEGQVTDVETLLRSLQREHEGTRRELDDVVRELDVLTLRVRAQGGVEAKQKAALEAAILEEKAHGEERDSWRAEEAFALKKLSAVKAARDLRARELAKIEAEAEAVRTDERMKELALTDLSKQSAEVETRLKQALTLYENVKAQRNGYVNAIQASAQTLAERKERVKIQAHELHILRNESAAKDAALAKERDAMVKAFERLKGKRQEANRERSAYREKQAAVEAQIVTIDRLNSLINAAEREMLELKGRYEAAVEDRNYAGIQLIDRNDELCILYEKSAVHERALQSGEQGLRTLELREKALELRRAELERGLRLARSRFHDIPDLAKRVLDLQQRVNEARETAAKLSAELEDPAVAERWTPLEGTDPDEESLRERVELLEARLGKKREELLEKELVLEEVSSLAEKLRTQAADGRESTAGRAQELLSLQGKVRELTRRMMAIVSELSMWQATSLKLQQERDGLDSELHAAEDRLAAGAAPTAEAERMLVRLEAAEARKLESAAASSSSAGASEGSADGSAWLLADGTRTTAPRRPNAYIPEDMGIPRPYGRHAPLGPAKPGATMRHIRVPKPKPIEL